MQDNTPFFTVFLTPQSVRELLDSKLIQREALQRELDAISIEVESLKKAMHPSEAPKVAAPVAAVSSTIATTSPTIRIGEYDPDWGWVNKFIYILRKEMKPMTTVAIVDRLLALEPTILTQTTRHYVTKRVSTAAHQKAEQGVVVVEIINNEKHFKLKEWTDKGLI